jgi:ataxin-3
VLEKALSAMWDLSVTPINATVAKNALEEQAFICNLSDHWFTIRRIGNKWYNLNSLSKRPEELSPFYLSLYIETLQGSGWSVFAVRGSLPPVTSNTICSEGGRWVPAAECVMQKSDQAKKNKSGGSDDTDLEAAIALSLAQAGDLSSSATQKSSTQKSPPTKHSKTSDDLDLEAAIALSLAGGTLAPSSHTNKPPAAPSHYQPLPVQRQQQPRSNDDDDAELQAALEASELDAAIAASLQKK